MRGRRVSRGLRLRYREPIFAVHRPRPLRQAEMHEIAILIERYGLVVVFVNIFLSQAGLPLPVYPTLVVAAALAAGSIARLPEIVAVAVAGSLLADICWFVASRRYGRRILGVLCKLSLSPDSCVRQTETLYARLGAASLLFARFVPGLGLVAIALSGITRVSAPVFVALDAAGVALYASTAVLLGFLFRNAISTALATLAQLGGFGLALVAVALAVWLLARWWQRRTFIAQLRMDRISAAELADMIDRGEKPVVVDVRAPEVRWRDGIIPGAVFAHPEDPQLSLAAYPRDAEIVVYCSCPNEVSAAVAARHLRSAGFRKIRPLSGGLEAWSELGRAIAHEPRPAMEIPEPAPDGIRRAIWSDLIS
ncbi:MAG TPA: rhodanese-like domain-containing protein [Rhizomicrobium sp.]